MQDSSQPIVAALLRKIKTMKLITLRLQQPEQRDIGTQLSPPMPIAQIARWGDLFGGAGSDSGEVVTPVSAMQTATVNACVRLISQSIAAMKPILYQKSGNGKQEAFDNPLYDILALECNPDATAFTTWESFVASILLTGNGFLEVETNKQGAVIGLWFLPPASVQPYRQSDGSIVYRCSEGLAPGQFRTLKSTQIVHVPGLSFNGVTGVSVIEQARNVIGSNLAMDKFNGRFFANNATPAVILTMPPGTKMKPEDKVKARGDWETLHSGPNQHRVGILDAGLDVKQLSISNADAEFLASRNFTRQEICGLFGLLPSQIGDTARVAGETFAAQQLTFLTDCLRPWLNKIEQELTRKLLPRSQNPGRKYTIAHDVSDRLKMDTKSQIEAFGTARQWGLMTANEARTGLGLNPGGPECDVFWAPLNTVDAKKLLEPTIAPTTVTLNE
ncbi:phage portal protein [Tunturiibacter lichenicola]|uniref:phage portal protein n=1 Tax=Tunturiibacter lichenicola TaxID=2051959 RepID=UPI003D9AE5BB